MGLQQQLNKAFLIAGNKNKYQKIVLCVFCILFYFNVLLLLGPSFYFMDPTFICYGSDEIVDQKEACPRLSQCYITNDFTITSYMGLICDRQGERNLIQSILSVGSLIGLIGMNVLADFKGRKLALIVDLIIATLSSLCKFISNLVTIIGAYTQTTFILAFSSFLAGFSGYSIIIICYIIMSDICEQEMRQKNTLYMNIAYSLGLISFFFFYNWINEWYNILVLFMFLPLIGLTCVCSILIQQSPNYYLCKMKNKQKCIDSLLSIACFNKKEKHEISEMQFIIQNVNFDQNTTKQQSQQKKSVFQILKQWKYLKTIICIAIVQSGGNLFFYGIQYAINDIGFNFGIDNLVLGSAEISCTIILSSFVNKLNRKKTLFLAYSITFISSFIFIFEFVERSPAFSTLLIIFIRISTTLGYFMIVMFQTESFPLQIQSIGAGTIQAFAQMGSIAAPLIIAFAINTGLQKMATMGVLLLICMIPLKFVQEPNHQNSQKELKDYAKLLVKENF